MGKPLAQRLIDGEKGSSVKESKPFTMSLPSEKYTALDELSKQTKVSKAQIVIMALEEAGVFEINKIARSK